MFTTVTIVLGYKGDEADGVLDVKANNVLIQTKESATGTDIELVQLADLEDAAHLPPGTAAMGAQLGNWMWRSPEAHAQGPIEKPSDMFSFGVVVSDSSCQNWGRLTTTVP